MDRRKSVAGLTALFMAVSPVQLATAQHRAFDEWLVSPDAQTPYLRDQYNLLAPHADFVKKTRQCCSLRDGRGNVEEVRNNGEDPRFPENPDYPENRFPYIVIITHDLKGNELKEPAAVYIPRDKIITAREAKDTCKPERILNPASTCVPPSFNVLWSRDESIYDEGIYGGYNPSLGGNLYGDSVFVYCYWPQPDVQ